LTLTLQSPSESRAILLWCAKPARPARCGPGCVKRGSVASLGTWAIDPGITGWTTTGATIVNDTTNKKVYITGITWIIPGDTNGDKVVDAADFITLKKNFGRTDAVDAQNGNFTSPDTNVNWADLGILMSNMGTGHDTRALLRDTAGVRRRGDVVEKEEKARTRARSTKF
jgi:hypothetical protein